MAARNNFSTIRSEVRLFRSVALFLLLVPLLASPSLTSAYSVLSHQAIIDSAWEDGLKPALLAKFPNATPEELSAAQAYAYGGAIIQDLGYYPYGSHFFSDLTHYVRSGDFILALLHDANDIYEFMNTVSRWARWRTTRRTITVIVSGRTAQCRCSIRI